MSLDIPRGTGRAGAATARAAIATRMPDWPRNTIFAAILCIRTRKSYRYFSLCSVTASQPGLKRTFCFFLCLVPLSPVSLQQQDFDRCFILPSSALQLSIITSKSSSIKIPFQHERGIRRRPTMNANTKDHAYLRCHASQTPHDPNRLIVRSWPDLDA